MSKTDDDPQLISQMIINCARCKKNHRMPFNKFQRPPKDADGVWKYWGVCPTTGEPLFLMHADLSDPDLKVLDNG